MSANVERVLNEIRALTPEEQREVRAALDTVLTIQPKPQMSEEEFEKVWAEGRAMSMEQAIAYALAQNDNNQDGETTG